MNRSHNDIGDRSHNDISNKRHRSAPPPNPSPVGRGVNTEIPFGLWQEIVNGN